MSNDFKCFIGLHKYKLLETKDLTNPYGARLGLVYVLQCTNCGKVKEHSVYTDTNYRRG